MTMTLAEMPAEGSTRVTTEGELEHLQRLARDVAQKHVYGVASTDQPVTERLNFKVAVYLQQHPRKELTLQQVADGTGLTTTQVSSVTQRFVEERTDVDRPRRGIIVYTPGKGPGIKPKEPGYGEVPVVKTRKPDVVPARKARVEDGETLRIQPGFKTADGRRVASDSLGVLYAVTPLT